MDKPRFDHGQQDAESSENMFTDVAEATAFWRMLWQTERNGSVGSEWPHEVRDALGEKLFESPEEAFELCVKQFERTTLNKRNWSTPDPA